MLPVVVEALLAKGAQAEVYATKSGRGLGMLCNREAVGCTQGGAGPGVAAGVELAGVHGEVDVGVGEFADFVVGGRGRVFLGRGNSRGGSRR